MASYNYTDIKKYITKDSAQMDGNKEIMGSAEDSAWMIEHEHEIVNDVLKEIYSTRRVTTDLGESIRFTSGINPPEGKLLYDLTLRVGAKKTLEIGMANGTSALYICEAHKKMGNGDESHISIDPFQTSQWKNVGRANLLRANLDNLSKVIEDYSHFALPELLKNGEKFDLIFIDGMHLFDYTIVDMFFADHLLNVGGLMIVDDIKHSNVKNAYKFLVRNYKHYTVKKSLDTMGVLYKREEDSRKWNFHRIF